MKKGDLVLIPFPFTDLSGKKLRPALILVESQSDVVVSFLTTQLHRQENFDLLIEPSGQNGLKKIINGGSSILWETLFLNQPMIVIIPGNQKTMLELKKMKNGD